MRQDLGELPLASRFEPYVQILGSARFLGMQGLGNEVPFFICPFDIAERDAMDAMVPKLLQRLEAQGLRVLRVDLFDLCLDLLRERDILDRIVEQEQELGKEALKELLQSVLDVKEHLVPAIESRVAVVNPQILFLTGVGEVFPYLRSHNLLNNLQSTLKGFPTVLFFPGKYIQSLEKGASLELFGMLGDDKYYRAFDLNHYEL